MTGRVGRCLAAWLLAAGLAACGESTARIPAPVEIGADSIAEFCSMALAEHPGPKAQIFLRGEAVPHWFASVHDALAYTMLLSRSGDVAAIYVNDMGRVRNWDQPEPGTWVEARNAVFVIESRRRGGMDAYEAVPFADRATASTFVGQYGGRLVGFADVPRSYILSESEPGVADAGRVRRADPKEDTR
jgi:copper chaperone NosL